MALTLANSLWHVLPRPFYAQRLRRTFSPDPGGAWRFLNHCLACKDMWLQVKGSLCGVAGRFLNSYRNNLPFENLAYQSEGQVSLRGRRIQEFARGTRTLGKCSCAGARCRAGGCVEISQGQGLVAYCAALSGRTGDRGQRNLVELNQEQAARPERNERRRSGRCQGGTAV